VEPTQRPSDRDLTREDIPGILAGLALAVAFLVLGALHPLLLFAVLVPAVVFAVSRIPAQQREAIGSELLRRERTPLGRVLRAAKVLGGLLVLYAVARAAVSSWQ